MNNPAGPAQLDCGGRMIHLDRPVIMGVLNVTPDSFSDGGNYYQGDTLDISHAVSRARELYEQGAAIIDVGGESTRPGAAPVTAEQEIARVLPVVKAIAAEIPAVISVDTSTPQLITAAADAGAGLINDVRALQRPGALAAAAATSLPVCLMHMQGEPDTMQQQPQYADVVSEVQAFFQQRVAACQAAGIDPKRLLLDPGFGFGKTLDHNLELLNRLDAFTDLGLPLLVGMSRKSMVGQVLDQPVDQRLYGSLAAAVLAVAKGAAIIRCHDVAATADAVKMAHAVVSSKTCRDE